MGKQVAFLLMLVALSLLLVIGMLSSPHPGAARQALAQPPAEPTEFVGLTKCAACHFLQYKEWQNSPHGNAYKILPAKYRNSAECLKCHATGSGQANIAKNTGVSCESCHGPGGVHAKSALRFVDEEITEQGLTQLRSKIHRIDHQRCIECHVGAAHKKHPEFDRDEGTKERTSRSKQAGSNFFMLTSVHGKPEEE